MEKKEQMMKCPYCKEKISINAKECPFCGKSMKVNTAVAGGVIVFVVVIMIILSVFGGNVSNGNSYAKKIENVVAVDSTQAKTINDILVSVGLNSFDSITHDDTLDGENGEGSTGYRIKTSFSENVILYLDSSKNVVSVRWADKDFYVNAQAVLNFKDYTMTFDEQSNYNVDAQDRIKKLLKSPSTAKFPSINDWKFAKDGGVVTVQAYVDSQNGFGAVLRSEFQIIYQKDGTLSSLIVDGTEYIQ